jgi:two-component system chemotaxis response regulator CheY
MVILIVDDNSVSRVALRSILTEDAKINDADIYEACDGQEGVEAYVKIKPDLVFLDINMPHVDGKTAAKRIFDIDKRAMVIMCTSSYVATDVAECIAAGAIDYLLKPPVPERVVKLVKDVMSDKFLQNYGGGDAEDK